MAIQFEDGIFKSKRDRQYQTIVELLVDLQSRFKSLSRKVDTFMASQEERLQAILSKIDEVLSDLAALKTNNPQIEDEISAIEAKLSIAQPPPTEPPTQPPV